MESKYTAIIFANRCAMQHETSNHLPSLIARLLMQLENALAGSYGVIHDNSLNMVIQRFNKATIED